MARMRNTKKAYEEAIAENASRDMDKAQEEAIAENAQRDKSKLTKLMIIIAVILAIVLAFIFFVPAQYKLILGIIAVIVAYTLLPKKYRAAFLVVAIAALIIIFFPTLKLYAAGAQNYASNIYSGIKTGGMSEGLTCIINSDKCYGAEAWESKGTQQIGGTTIKVDWTGVTRTLNQATVPIQVTTQKPMTIEFACFNAGGDISTTPQNILFEKSTTKSLICSAQTIGEKLGVRMKSSYDASLNFEIWAGKGDSKGKLNIVNSDGPYTVEISSIDEQPFSVKVPLAIKLKKTSSSVFELTSIETFDVSSKDKNLKITCDKMTGDKEALKGNFANNIYSFICYIEVSADVSELPQQPVKGFVSVNLNYKIEGKDSTTLKTEIATVTSVLSTRA